MVGAEDILFVGQSADARFYQRIMLPAMALGCGWCGLDSPPPRMTLGRGEVAFGAHGPDLSGYRIVVVHTPWQKGWSDLIADLQAGGTVVFFDTDYDLHALVGNPEVLAQIETLLRMCDGLICATEYIAERYAAFNGRTYLCENGINLDAYVLTRPPHDTVNIGWSGISGLADEMLPWLHQIAGVMRIRDRTNFVSIGHRLGDAVAAMGVVAPERCLAIPGVLPEQYPAAASIFDIVFDPAGQSAWRLARSQLRWLEAAAWGIPMVGDPRIYPNIEDGVTGFHATSPIEVAQTVLGLVDDPLLRAAVGERAKRVVAERYSMQAVAPQWARVFEQVAA